MAAEETAGTTPVINFLTLALTHSLMALAAILLLSRDELDDEEAKPGKSRKWGRAGANRTNSDTDGAG